MNQDKIEAVKRPFVSIHMMWRESIRVFYTPDYRDENKTLKTLQIDMQSIRFQKSKFTSRMLRPVSHFYLASRDGHTVVSDGFGTDAAGIIRFSLPTRIASIRSPLLFAYIATT